MGRGELQGGERCEGGGSLTQKRDRREGKDADADWEVGHGEGKYGNYEEREERWERSWYYTVVPSSSPASQHCFSIERENKIHIR